MGSASSHPPRRKALKPRVHKHDDGHDDDHAQCHGVAQAGIVQDVALDLRANDDRYQVQETAGKGVRRGIRAKGIAEEQNGSTQKRREKDGQGDIAPIVVGAAAEVLTSLAPLTTQTIQGRSHDEHHQGELEVHVDDAQTPEVVDAEALGMYVSIDYGLDDACDQSSISHRSHEGKS